MLVLAFRLLCFQFLQSSSPSRLSPDLAVAVSPQLCLSIADSSLPAQVLEQACTRIQPFPHSLSFNLGYNPQTIIRLFSPIYISPLSLLFYQNPIHSYLSFIFLATFSAPCPSLVSCYGWRYKLIKHGYLTHFMVLFGKSRSKRNPPTRFLTAPLCTSPSASFSLICLSLLENLKFTLSLLFTSHETHLSPTLSLPHSLTNSPFSP
ncbi:hypothetical protein LXL04_036945 [Taraxacum kok-saghyz]